MEYRILGPLEVVDEGEPVLLGRLKERLVLAVLLLHANEFVSRERLIDELWGVSPPATARKAVNVYISNLRKTLTRDGHDAITTAEGGYRLVIDTDSLDADRHRRLVVEAHESIATGESETGSQLLQQARALWRGPALAGLQLESFGRDELAELDELRLAALMDRIDCDLALGRHEQVLGELNLLVREHPLRERLRAQQMLALYRADRQAEALDAYAEARRTLVDDLGIEPSEALQRLQQAILRHDPSLETPEGAAAVNGLAALRQDPSLDVHRVEPKRVQRTRRRRALPVAIAAGALAVGLAVMLGLRGGSGRQITANHAAALDPRTANVEMVVPVGLKPTAIARVGGRIYVSSGEDNAVIALDARTGRRIRAIPVGGTVTALSGAGQFLWAVEFFDRDVLVIPLGSPSAVTHVRLRRFDGVERPVAVAATSDGAWIGTDRGRLLFARPGGGSRQISKLDLPIRALAF